MTSPWRFRVAEGSPENGGLQQLQRGVLVQTRADTASVNHALAVQHTCFTDSCTAEV
jgi:hypothetical protein